MTKVINNINEDIVGVSSTSGTNINSIKKFSFVNMANKRKTDKNVCENLASVTNVAAGTHHDPSPDNLSPRTQPSISTTIKTQTMQKLCSL